MGGRLASLSYVHRVLRSCGLRRGLTRLSVLCVLFVWSCGEGSPASHLTNTELGALSERVEGESHTIAGTVFGGGLPLAGALVQAFIRGASTASAEIVTDTTGSFALLVADGTYDLRVTPPAGGEFVAQLISNLVLDGADRRHDVVLVARAAAINGFVRGHGGVPVPDTFIRFQDLVSGVTVATTTSDASGAYDVELSPGQYRLFLQPSSFPAPEGVPNGSWFFQPATIEVSGATTFDIALPIVRLAGVVRDADGTAVQGVSLTANASLNRDDTSGFAASSAQTDAAGAYELLSFQGNTTFVLVPPPGFAGLVETVEVDSDVQRDFLLPAAIQVTGQILGYAGTPAASTFMVAREANTGATVATTISDELGGYALELAPGRYRFSLQPNEFPLPAGTPNQSWFVDLAVGELTSSTTLDVQLPVSRVAGRVSDVNDAPVAGVSVTVSASAFDGERSSFSTGQATTGTDGAYELLTFDGSATVVLAPPPGFAPTAETTTIAGDAQRNFVTPSALRLTGQVRGHGGRGAAATFVQLSDIVTGVTLTSQLADELGRYGFDVAPGQYRLVLQPGQFPTPEGTPNQGWFFQTGSIGVSDSTTFDVQLPVSRIDGIATDENGVPVPRVSLRIDGFHADADSFASGGSQSLTGDGGTYELFAFTGNATFQATPPSGSGFSTAVLSGLTISGDFSQTVALQQPDLLAPDIVAGPIVVHLSDTSVSVRWDTDEPADSVVEYGVGALSSSVRDASPVTRHEVTLVDLVPASIHLFRVGSTDASGNGPTTSELGSFVTQEPPGDITPPLITGGPEVVSVGLNDALIHWSTDEPSNGVVHFGLTDTLGETTTIAVPFTVEHLVTLSGLDPDTRYFYLVESTDPDGNGPTPSAIATFTTASAPDGAPPFILEGPEVAARTATTLTVRWITDEPADSGVSANDGTSFFVSRDGALASEHELVLAGLTPDTEYEITVSSTDRNGNGPTLGGPILATTLSTLDTDPPLIINVVVSDITSDGALITWSTNEPATSQVQFGPTPDALTGVVGDARLVTEHSVLLTGLSAASEQSFFVASADAGGQSARSSIASFITLADEVEEPDTDGDGVPDSSDRCPDTPAGDHTDARGCSLRCPPSIHEKHHRVHRHTSNRKHVRHEHRQRRGERGAR